MPLCGPRSQGRLMRPSAMPPELRSILLTTFRGLADGRRTLYRRAVAILAALIIIPPCLHSRSLGGAVPAIGEAT